MAVSKKISDVKAVMDDLDTAIDAIIALAKKPGGMTQEDLDALDALKADITAHRDSIHAVTDAPPTPDTPPVISSIFPTTGAVGTEIAISGTGFGATQGSSTVSLAGNPVTPTRWGDATVQILVPQMNEGAYDIVVTENGAPSNTVQFTVTL